MPLFQTLLLSSLVFLATYALCAAAHADQSASRPVYKCRADGKVSYGDRPCPSGPSQTLPPPASQSDAGIPAGDTAGFGTGDARALLELEKERTELARQQAIAAREQRALARTGRVQVKQVQHCGKLRLQQKWLEEDLAKAHTPAQQETLRTRLRRHSESMAVECPA